MQNNISTTPLVDKEELKRFYKQDVLNLVKVVFFQPGDGIQDLFLKRSEKTYFHSLVLIASASVLSMFLIYFILPSQIREYISGFGILFRSALASVVFLLLVSLSSFAIKLISGKPQFRNELLTGGLCAIPLLTLLLLLFIASKLIMDESTMQSLAFGDFAFLFQKAGLMLVLVFYVLLMFINILQQSLRAAGTNELIRWYLSPVGMLLSFYLTYKIVGLFS